MPASAKVCKPLPAVLSKSMMSFYAELLETFMLGVVLIAIAAVVKHH